MFEEEEELLLTSSSMQHLSCGTKTSVAPGTVRRAFAGACVAVEEDDDDVSFVAQPLETLAARSLKAQRFGATLPPATDSASAATNTTAAVMSSIALEAAQTDVDEEAERLRVDVPSDADVLGDRAAFLRWRERQENRRALGRLTEAAAR
jgi:uncharacterized protein YjiS (DUF1127 family)